MFLDSSSAPVACRINNHLYIQAVLHYTLEHFHTLHIDILLMYLNTHIHKIVKWSRYRPGVAQRVGRGIALLFHDRSTRRGWLVSSMPRPHFTPGKDLVPIVQEAGWALGPVWTGGKSRPHRDSIPDHLAHSRYTKWATRPAHTHTHTHTHSHMLQRMTVYH